MPLNKGAHAYPFLKEKRVGIEDHPTVKRSLVSVADGRSNEIGATNSLKQSARQLEKTLARITIDLRLSKWEKEENGA
jgi:hypothetical protein